MNLLNKFTEFTVGRLKFCEIYGKKNTNKQKLYHKKNGSNKFSRLILN